MNFAESGTWNGLGGLLLGVSGAVKIEGSFSAFGWGNNEWAIIAFIAAMGCFVLGIILKGSSTPHV